MTIAVLIATGVSLQACGGLEAISAPSNTLQIDEASSRLTNTIPPSSTGSTLSETIGSTTIDIGSAFPGVAENTNAMVQTADTTDTAAVEPATAPTIVLASAPTAISDASIPASVANGTDNTVTIGSVPLPVMTVTINGAAAPATYLDTLRTRSGNWQLHSLGQHGDYHAYLMRLESKPEFGRVMACRRPFTKEAGNTLDLSVLTSNITLSAASGSWNWSLGIAQGACRVVQNTEPVTPNAQWLRDAVAERRLPAYSRARAWFPALLKPLAVDARRGAYDPLSLGPVPGASATVPNSSNNYVGVTSGQGGEYFSSRGFIHDADAKLVDAALSHEDSLIASTWSEFVQYTWYSLAQPQGAVWSDRIHTTVDPQFPQAGETAWENPIWVTPKPEIRSLTEVTGWKRDVHHMENTGFVHWVVTEDPVAGLLVQRQAAYALASFYENYRKSADTTYKVLTDQERGVYNALSTLWKSRDVSRRVGSSSGTMIWDSTRTQKQALDAIAYLEEKMVSPIRNAVPGSSDDYARKIAGAVLTFTFNEGMNTPVGQTTMTMSSHFMLPQYGKEPLYLWASDGNLVVKSWLEMASGYVATRLVDVGGAAGVDGCVGIRGSSFPLKVAGSAPSFNDRAGWAAWVNQQCPTANRANFDGAWIHTSIQMEGVLLLARSAGISGLDPAIERVRLLRTATTAPHAVTYMQWHKHLAGPPN